MSNDADLAIVGAGPAGALLAILAARRGMHVTLVERRGDPRGAKPEAGRSINLALAARGIRALETAGLMPALAPLLVRMPGRQLHLADGSQVFNAYGLPGETNYSISRVDLTRCLIEAAGREPRITLRFRQRCTGLAPSGHALLVDEDSGHTQELPARRLIGADGAGSPLRKALAQTGHVVASNELLDHDYRELTIPPVNGGSALAVYEALHIWPRRGFMLIALPNADFSFTATLFLPREGACSFASLAPPGQAWDFFAREFPDALAAMPDFKQQFATHRQGILGTVRCTPWNHGEQLLLIGDAAHAIVPFHGQGMNCALEDCVILDSMLADGLPAAFARFSAARRRDTDAIAAMSLENYGEMRDEVLDPRFQQQQALSLQLQQRHPDRFIPRYSMVMFHPGIPYSVAMARGAAQQQLLDELVDQHAAADSALADRLVAQGLSPLPAEA